MGLLVDVPPRAGPEVIWPSGRTVEIAAFGDAFVTARERLRLVVPPAVIPEGSNIVVNPRHPRMADDVRMEIVREFAYDPRLRH